MSQTERSAGPLARLVSGLFGGGANYTDDHIPAPAPHVPALEARQTQRGSFRVEEPDREDAWIEMYDPVEAREVA